MFGSRATTLRSRFVKKIEMPLAVGPKGIAIETLNGKWCDVEEPVVIGGPARPHSLVAFVHSMFNR